MITDPTRQLSMPPVSYSIFHDREYNVLSPEATLLLDPREEQREEKSYHRFVCPGSGAEITRSKAEHATVCLEGLHYRVEPAKLLPEN